MNNSTASVLGIIYALSELGLTLKKRAKAEESRNEDRGSLGLLWIVIVASVTLAFSAAYALPAPGMSEGPTLRFLGIAIFAARLPIPSYPIALLSPFFTANVTL